MVIFCHAYGTVLPTRWHSFANGKAKSCQLVGKAKKIKGSPCLTMVAKSYLCGIINRKQTMIEVTDVALRQAAGEGMDAFIGVFTDAYKKEIGG